MSSEPPSIGCPKTPRRAGALLRLGLVAGALVVAILLSACGGSGSDENGAGSTTDTGGSGGDASGREFPDIVGAEATPAGEGAFNFAVTVSSPYDSPERYADGWRILTPDGEVLGERPLLHDHANEQPFTRTLDGVAVPEGVSEVVIEGRDLENGWGGGTLTLELGR